MNIFQSDTSYNPEYGARELNRIMMECADKMIAAVGDCSTVYNVESKSLSSSSDNVSKGNDENDDKFESILSVDISDNLSGIDISFKVRPIFHEYDIDRGSEIMMRMILSDIYISALFQLCPEKFEGSDLFDEETGKIVKNISDGFDYDLCVSSESSKQDAESWKSQAENIIDCFNLNSEMLLRRVSRFISRSPFKRSDSNFNRSSFLNKIMKEKIWRLEKIPDFQNSGKFRYRTDAFKDLRFCFACLRYFEIYAEGIQLEIQSDSRNHVQDTYDLISTIKDYPLFRYISELQESSVRNSEEYITEVIDFLKEIDDCGYKEKDVRKYMSDIIDSMRYLYDISEKQGK